MWIEPQASPLVLHTHTHTYIHTHTQELDKYIRQVGGAEGIVNGMDVEEWDPRMDKYLAVKYDKASVHAGKAAAKEALQVCVCVCVCVCVSCKMTKLLCMPARLPPSRHCRCVCVCVCACILLIWFNNKKPKLIPEGPAMLAVRCLAYTHTHTHTHVGQCRSAR